jgi:arabinogalactan endo-1,4-beta-galactosidase
MRIQPFRVLQTAGTCLLLLCVAAGPVRAQNAVAGRPAPESRQPTFLTGGDVTFLAREGQLGAVYRDGGKPIPALDIFRAHGWNLLRLRIWVHPSGEGEGVNDLPYTVAFGRRIKASGFKLLLDFHYSDTWADPGHQTKPAAWQDLPFPALEKQVETYSRDVIAAMRLGGAMPDIVAVGNETTNGMLWPDGKLDSPEGWERYGALMKAGVRGVREGAGSAPAPQIMVHIDRGGAPGLAVWFFDNLARHAPDLNFDVIGLSYYPDGKNTLADLRTNLGILAKRYRRPILIAETAFPHAGAAGPNQPVYAEYGLTPDGQRRYLGDLVALVRAVPDGLGRGVLYWEPEWLAVPGLPQYWGENPLFDKGFNALPGVAALDARER